MFCICCWNRNCMPGFGIPLWCCVIISLIIMLCCHWSELSYSPCMMIRLDMFWIPTSPVLFWALPTSLVTLSITQFPIWHSVAWTIALVTLSITQLPPVRMPCFGWAGSWAGRIYWSHRRAAQAAASAGWSQPAKQLLCSDGNQH